MWRGPLIDPDEIRRIASELYDTQCNDRVAIIIPGVQCKNKNAPNFYNNNCIFIIELIKPYVLRADSTAD